MLRGTFCAVQPLGKELRHGRLAGPSRAAEQIRMGHSVELNGVPDGSDYVFLTDDVLKGLRSVFSVERQVAHGDTSGYQNNQAPTLSIVSRLDAQMHLWS